MTLETQVKDPRLGMVTITDAKVTPDLREATLYYTVYGSDEERHSSALALESAKGVLRKTVGQQTGVRYTPVAAVHRRRRARDGRPHRRAARPRPRRRRAGARHRRERHARRGGRALPRPPPGRQRSTTRTSDRRGRRPRSPGPATPGMPPRPGAPSPSNMPRPGATPGMPPRPGAPRPGPRRPASRPGHVPAPLPLPPVPVAVPVPAPACSRPAAPARVPACPVPVPAAVPVVPAAPAVPVVPVARRRLRRPARRRWLRRPSRRPARWCRQERHARRLRPLQRSSGARQEEQEAAASGVRQPRRADDGRRCLTRQRRVRAPAARRLAGRLRRPHQRQPRLARPGRLHRAERDGHGDPVVHRRDAAAARRPPRLRRPDRHAGGGGRGPARPLRPHLRGGLHRRGRPRQSARRS